MARDQPSIRRSLPQPHRQMQYDHLRVAGCSSRRHGAFQAATTPFVGAFFSGFPAHSTTDMVRGKSSAVNLPPPFLITPRVTNSCREAVTHPADGMNVARVLRVVFQLLAQPRNVHID